jgi:ferric-dicitrate binding protein FerR (iron transport regulator)
MTDVRDLLAQLDAPAALRSTEQAERADVRHVRILARQIARVPRQRRRAKLVRGAVVGALGLVSGLAGLWFATSNDAELAVVSSAAHVRSVEGELRVERAEGSFVARAGDPLAVGDRVALAPTASSTIAISKRSEVELSGRARLEIVTAGVGSERLQLDTGQARFAVRPPRGAFFVESPHLEVQVTGTQFSVTVEAERSCVIVHSGQVVATSRTSSRSVTLAREQAFSSDGAQCTSLPVVEWVAPESAPLPEQAAVPRSAPSAAAPAEQHRSTPQVPTSTLEEENRMLLAAIAARRDGRLAAARAQLEQLLRRYPETPLRAAAENELTRIAEAERSIEESEIRH